MLSPLVAAAGQAADDDVEERDNAVDDGHADATDAVNDGHKDIADGLADALKLKCLLVTRVNGVGEDAYAGDDCTHGVRLLESWTSTQLCR